LPAGVGVFDDATDSVGRGSGEYFDLSDAVGEALQSTVERDENGVVGGGESRQIRVRDLLMSENRVKGIPVTIGGRRRQRSEIDVRRIRNQPSQ